jgi:hypothetical protein
VPTSSFNKFFPVGLLLRGGQFSFSTYGIPFLLVLLFPVDFSKDMDSGTCASGSKIMGKSNFSIRDRSFSSPACKLVKYLDDLSDSCGSNGMAFRL